MIESLREMRAEIRQLSSELRHMCAELRPPLLDTLGLGAALRAYTKEWSSQTNVKTRLVLSPDAALRDLPDEVSVNLYRVAQEALINIGKHAGARQVEISLSWEEGQLVMTIRDDGHGFTLPDTIQGLTARNHFGLAGMRERVNLIGGQWSLQSLPGQGTTIQVRWQGTAGQELAASS